MFELHLELGGLSRITEDYIYIAETDHVLMRPLPNLATEDKAAAFGFGYMHAGMWHQSLITKFAPGTSYSQVGRRARSASATNRGLDAGRETTRTALRPGKTRWSGSRRSARDRAPGWRWREDDEDDDDEEEEEEVEEEEEEADDDDGFDPWCTTTASDADCDGSRMIRSTGSLASTLKVVVAVLVRVAKRCLDRGSSAKAERQMMETGIDWRACERGASRRRTFLCYVETRSALPLQRAPGREDHDRTRSANLRFRFQTSSFSFASPGKGK